MALKEGKLIQYLPPTRIPELAEKAKKLVVSAGNDPKADIGPLVSKKAKERVLRLIESGIKQGAKLVLDGRNVSVSFFLFSR